MTRLPFQLKEGLQAITQQSMLLTSQVAYHDYEGVALDLDERAAGSRYWRQETHGLRNHGTLAVGENCALAFIAIYFLSAPARRKSAP